MPSRRGRSGLKPPGRDHDAPRLPLKLLSYAIKSAIDEARWEDSLQLLLNSFGLELPSATRIRVLGVIFNDPDIRMCAHDSMYGWNPHSGAMLLYKTRLKISPYADITVKSSVPIIYGTPQLWNR